MRVRYGIIAGRRRTGLEVHVVRLWRAGAFCLKNWKIPLGWERGTRTPAAGTKTRCPTARRSPTVVNAVSIVSGISGNHQSGWGKHFVRIFTETF